MKSKNVATEGGTRPSISVFDATSAGILIALIVTITKKNEMSKVTPKNTAVPII
ncbi:MAG TPA: hypothetical protein VJL79_05675 [Nitrososphaera sp.]|nr:hypothetical protein [Nitrososphaera sp.]